ncbi:MFS transporter [Fulvimonas soli]|jgi:MHS family proline/betaine transporter-like MFS transporter|uniref:MHS family proline/betaine transporter-like MFS transporter n=1 Tax=Fulvimonas soli TaxID=155197 RepID=A0A316I5I7_9GAMM|nr:MFS transporter [Fulvimonas soli]PWK87751.1 MHS family proline/betaine transporter-like MFS transporter [Fulvimonas soli]TNY26536.1 MFS transporter [Fulvimonas soli]
MTRTEKHSAAEVSHGSKVIAALSTVVEWYDFTLYLYFATVLSRVFFGGGGNSLLVTLAGFAVSYGMRPLGAMVFGHLGDRIGRRRTLLLSMMLMTLAMLATALLPGHAAIGPAAGALLLLLRCFMAFSVGGEYTGVVAYLLEGARKDRRGLVTSLASAASEVGALLAVALSALTVGAMDAARLDAWGWRLPFLAGAVLAGGVWFARSSMDESPDFLRQVRRRSVPDSPLRHALAHHRPALLRTFAVSALGSITYYVGITYLPAFLTSSGLLAEGRSLGLSTLAAVAVILVTPLAGALSDRIGRRPVLIGLAVASLPLPLAMFGLMAAGGELKIATGAIVLACLAGGVSAVGAPATAEQFPGEGRLSGLALGVTVATAIFGGLTPFLAELLVRLTGWTAVPGAMIAAVALAVLPAFLRMPETHPLLARRGRRDG